MLRPCYLTQKQADMFRKYCNSSATSLHDVYKTYITALTTKNDRFIRNINPDGSLDHTCVAYDRGGVRPLICLDNGTLVEVQNDE